MDVCLGAGQWAAAFSLSEALEALGRPGLHRLENTLAYDKCIIFLGL